MDEVTRPFPAVLREGSNGVDVRSLQYYLDVISYFNDAIPDIDQDGYFGPATTAAVRAFQTLAGLPADGIVGLQTWLRLRQAWLEGKWDVFQGQFFQEFVDDPAHYRDRRFTHVIEPFDIPREWSIWRSYDFGYAKPFSCGWWAVDHDGCVYRILELYGCTGEPDEGVKWTPEKQFAEIRRIEDTHPWLKGRDILGVADPAIWDSSRGESIYETALKHRIFFMKGDNRRIPGWMQMHYRMAFDEEGYPQLYVFTGCRAFRRTVPGLLFSETEPEDLDTRMEDHVADESRYLCMARPIPPRRVETALPVQDDPLNMLARR